jgi:hypothetical protein
MRKPKKAGDDLNISIERDALCHEALRPTVESDNHDSNREVESARRVLGHS